jgi:hypothetical protein
MTRAIFYSRFPQQENYRSPIFYKQHGLDFEVKIINSDSKAFKNAAPRVAVWLNQNFVIRLFGILDSKGFIKLGLDEQENIIKLIKILRNNVGAHSTGKRVSKRGDLKKATKLINQLFQRQIDIEEVKNFTLSVDSVLFPMKTQTIEYLKMKKKQHIIT